MTHDQSFRAQFQWLAIEYLGASSICGLVVSWAGQLSTESLHQGLILAALFMLPAEVLRQFGGRRLLTRVSEELKLAVANAHQTKEQSEFRSEVRLLQERTTAIQQQLADLQAEFQNMLVSAAQVAATVERVADRSAHVREDELARWARLARTLESSASPWEQGTRIWREQVERSLEEFGESLKIMPDLLSTVRSVEAAVIRSQPDDPWTIRRELALAAAPHGPVWSSSEQIKKWILKPTESPRAFVSYPTESLGLWEADEVWSALLSEATRELSQSRRSSGGVIMREGFLLTMLLSNIAWLTPSSVASGPREVLARAQLEELMLLLRRIRQE